MVLTGLVLAGGVFVVGKRVRTRRQKQKELSLFLNRSQNIEPQPLIPQRGLVKYGIPTTLVAAAGISSYWWFAGSSAGAALALPGQVTTFMRASQFGPLLYTLASTLRPLVLFPVSVMTIVGGYLYGPVWGTVYATIGGIASAALAYRAGRYWPSDLGTSERNESFIARYAQRLREHPFASVFLMRLSFLHYDLVSYGAGMLQVGWRPFILGTVLGSTLITIPLVLIGASLSGLSSVSLLNPPLLIASGTVLAGSLVIWYFLKTRQDASATDPLLLPMQASQAQVPPLGG